EKFGAALTSPCAATGLREHGGHLIVQLADGTEVAGRAVIVASGAHYRRLDAAGLDEFECKGVYYAATETEVRQCPTAPVVVVGGAGAQRGRLSADRSSTGGLRTQRAVGSPGPTAASIRDEPSRIVRH